MDARHVGTHPEDGEQHRPNKLLVNVCECGEMRLYSLRLLISRASRLAQWQRTHLPMQEAQETWV